MTASEEINARRAEAFTVARDIVVEWRASGRRSTTAGVTSKMKQLGTLDLELLGLGANKEFWEQATASGLLSVEQQANGHWFVLLPGEQLSDFDVQPKVDTHAVSAHDPELRLKSEVWTSFVDWNTAFRRFWDRSHGRAFMVPASPGWVPEAIDTSLFTEIQPALQDTQIGWMRTFADSCPEPDRTALHVSLADHAPRGAFRRELRDRGLSRAWRDALRAHILDKAVGWAQGVGIDVSSIMENRHRDTDAAVVRTATSSPFARVAPPSTLGVASTLVPPEPEARGRVALDKPSIENRDRADVLRQKLHRVIDLMSWEELGQLPVRAEHLLDS